MSRKIIGPFNRVEGDLEVQVDLVDGRVKDAWVVSPLYRGFERMLIGKSPQDSLVFTPRICGICSVSQSVAAAKALQMAQGLEMPENGQLSQNLVLAAENIADHLTHFYLFFMPDFCRKTYANEPWFERIFSRFQAIRGKAAKDVLEARAEFMHCLGLLAGKWPHSLAIQPGGSTKMIERPDQMRLIAILQSFRGFLEDTLFGSSLEDVVSLSSVNAMKAHFSGGAAAASDFGQFLEISEQLELNSLGAGPDLFMSYGNYTDLNGNLFYPSGTYKNGKLSSLDQSGIAEDVSHSWVAAQGKALHPYDGATVPDADQAQGYSWCKAPRLKSAPAEVGALARHLVAGLPLFKELTNSGRGNVEARIVARLFEIAESVMAMEAWVRELKPKQPVCAHGSMEKETEGYGLVEAARGALGHWVKVSKGRIINYQIIAPTTWNFSPRDASGQPGPLEMALIGASLREGEADQPVAIQHIVRSFDPCMVCTVH